MKMLVDVIEKINALYKRISESTAGKLLKILCHPSDDYKGYGYIKIYNKNADKNHMLQCLSEFCKTEETVTIRAAFDAKRNLNDIAKELKKAFEPLKSIFPYKKAR